MDSWKDCVLPVSNEYEVFLSESTMKPIKVHVHSFGYALCNCVSDDAVDDNVVKMN